MGAVAMPALGPYQLIEPLGQGGMGQVFRAMHGELRLPVAVKVMTAATARDPYYVERFAREVQYVASLDHANVVAVYDHGLVDARAEETTAGQLCEGSPWLAMELASGGSLSPVLGCLPWSDQRRVLLSVLTGLAHSHARGVLHRDLKPGNVLLEGRRAPILLCDFWLAHPTGRTDWLADDELVGTPAYMAPEQVDADWRAYGPWTDLYALGWLAWVLACGEHPWRGAPGTVLFKQLEEEPPTFRPAAGVPEGLEGWLRRLLHKQPDQRFGAAADAAWALMALPGVEDEVQTARASSEAQSTLRIGAALADVEASSIVATLPMGSAAAAQRRGVGAGPAPELPPVPESWRGPGSSPLRLATRSLGLYGARPVPLVGRLAERDALWDGVRRCREAPCAAVLRGPAGVGKSRLAGRRGPARLAPHGGEGRTSRPGGRDAPAAGAGGARPGLTGGTRGRTGRSGARVKPRWMFGIQCSPCLPGVTVKSFRTNATHAESSASYASNSYSAVDSNSAQLELLEGETEKERLARAQPVSSLPGAAQGEQVKGLAVHNASMVESKSNDSQTDADKSWHAMNSEFEWGYTLDHAEKGTPASTPVHLGFEKDEQRAKEAEVLGQTGINTLGDYRKMVREDFNFGHVVTKFTQGTGATNPRDMYNKGMAGFLQATVDRFYPGKKVADPEVKVCVELARNIWSYATLGFDCSGTTDIAEMQGLLYVFDQQIRKSSDTNTKMAEGKTDEDFFILPGTEDWETPIKILKGDGRHGRATILTTRHLLANMTEKPPEETGLQGYDQTFMAIDKSGSMQTDEFGKLSKMLAAGGITGDVALAGFDSDPSALAKVDSGKPMKPMEARKVLGKTSADVGKRREANAKDKSVSASQGMITSGAPELGNASGNMQHEQGLANALTWVKAIKGPKVKRQMVVVTDEPDFNPGVFDELKKEAASRSVDVKVLYSFHYKDGKKVPGGHASHFVIIDLADMATVKQAWLIDREETKQLDWGLVADELGVKVHQWSSY